MSKNDFFDKNDYKTNSEWKLQLTLGWYLSPTIDFDNMIHITAFLKPIYLRGNLKWPLKCWKMMFLTKVITKNNSNSKLWPILAGYLTLILHFNNMIQDAGEPKITPLNCQKMFLTQNHYITNDDWKLWNVLAWYLSPAVDFNNIIHFTALMKSISLRGSWNSPS